MVKIVYDTKEIILKQFFTQNFSPFWPYDVILTPKTALFEHFWQIFADFSLLLNYRMEFASHRTIVDIVNNTLENILKQIFPQIFHYFGPVTSFFPKKALFVRILSKFYQISAFCSTITWKLPHNPWSRFFIIRRRIFETVFPYIFNMLDL